MNTWLPVISASVISSVAFWELLKWVWKKVSDWRGRPGPKQLDVIPQRFRVTLNRSVPDMTVDLLVVNYTHEPIHLSSLKVPWIQFASAQTVKDIGATHVDIPARSAKTVSCYRELTDAYNVELRRATPPYGVMAGYEQSALTVEYEGTIGKRHLPHKVLNDLRIPTGQIDGLPYVIVKESSLWRRFKLRAGVEPPAFWLKEDRLFEGQLVVSTFDQNQVQVMLRKPGKDSVAVNVPLLNLIDVEPVK